METPIKTPCNQICAVDGRTGWCVGCGRTLAEIGQWSQFADAERETVLSQLPQRMDHLKTHVKLASVS